MPRPFVGSVARRGTLEPGEIGRREVERDGWRSGDLVLGRILSADTGGAHAVESVDGRMIEVMEGDLVVGALGRRHATLEVTGDWEQIGGDGAMHALTSACVFGRMTSVSRMLPAPIELRYEGHVAAGSGVVRMADLAISPRPAELRCPVVLLIGTSMDAGKTVSARTIVRRLVARGLRVGGAKLTGVGRYRDILAMRDAGAEPILDFIDAGLPSTVCPRPEFEAALARITSALAVSGVDAVVAEAGASPLEPYNGAAAIEALAPVTALTVLCASDPYSVVGVIEAFGLVPDLIAGRCTSTLAGVELVERLTGIRALNLIDPEAIPQLDRVLDGLT
ncbi:MAG: hypothetical protein U0R52_09175 [Solirubrobacterales bacterium]